MKKRLILLTLLSMFMVGCDNNPSTSSNQTTSSIVNDIHVESIEITNKEVTTLKVGQTLALNVKVLPSNATNDLINYSSSDDKVASVSFNGVITAKSKGTCTITASSDDGKKEDTLTINVIESTVSSFEASFASEVDTVTSNGTLFYKLILNKEYKLNFSFSSTNKEDEIVECEFNLDGYCSFENNTLKTLKKVDALLVTFKVKGTSLKKEFNVKIINEGEKDISEVLNLLESSINKEDQNDIASYKINLDINTLDVYENRTHLVQETDYDIYKSTSDRYMLGSTTGVSTFTSAETKVSKMTNIYYQTFKGMSEDGNYYEYQIDNDGNHLTYPLKKQIVTSVSDKNSQITRSDALNESTKFSMNSHLGLSRIARFQFTGLYENSIGKGSKPLYFGMEGRKNLSITQEGNVIKADTFFVDEKVSSVSKGKVYFNHSEYTFDDNETLITIKNTSYIYDNTAFDFTNNILNNKDNYIESYSLTYSHVFGEIKTQEINPLDPQNLYFTSYTPILVDKNGKKVTEFVVGEQYYISYENQSPKMATSYIDSLIIDDLSNKVVATINNEGKGIIINKSGTSKLTIYSTKNRIKTELIINIGVSLPSAIKGYINDQEVSETSMNVGETIDNIVFKVLPNDASNEIEVTTSGVGTLTNNGSSYSFTSLEEGKCVITAKSKVNDVSTTLVINVNKKQTGGSFMDNLIGGVYSCKDSKDIYEGRDCYSNKLEIISKTEAKFSFESCFSREIYQIKSNIVIDETNKTITFTSFELGDNYKEYVDSFMPFIKQNVAFKISSDASEIELNLIGIDGDSEYDYSTLDSAITTVYTFKKEK